MERERSIKKGKVWGLLGGQGPNREKISTNTSTYIMCVCSLKKRSMAKNGRSRSDFTFSKGSKDPNSPDVIG